MVNNNPNDKNTLNARQGNNNQRLSFKEQEIHNALHNQSAGDAYDRYKSFIKKKSKYKLLNNKRPRRILWPFGIIIPIFLTGVIVNMITGNSIFSSLTGSNNKKSENLSNAKSKDSQQKNLGQAQLQQIVEVQNKNSQQTNENNKNLQIINRVASLLDHALSSETIDKIKSDPDTFINDLNTVISISEKDLLILVDKKHSLPSTYVAQDLVKLDDYQSKLFLNKKGQELRKIMLPHLIAMVENAKSNYGLKLVISSAYRSYEYQKTVFNRNSKELGEEEANKISAYPGESQHQLGTAIDFGSIDDSFTKTKESAWLIENAWKFGFSLSYPNQLENLTGYVYESWHYRYIGIPASTLENKYFNGIQQHMLEFIHYYIAETTKS